MKGKPREAEPFHARRAGMLLVTIGIGVAYGALLVIGLDARYPSASTPSAPVRVTFIEAPPPPPDTEPEPELVVEPPPLPQLPIEADPLTPEALNPARDEPPPPEELAADEILEDNGLADAALPVQPSSDSPEEDPYAELRKRSYPEAPGGDVLVLALLLDRHGHVWNAQIMVPSSNPLGDLTRMLSLPGTTLQPIPEIAPGEKRWIDLRFRYPSQTVALP